MELKDLALRPSLDNRAVLGNRMGSSKTISSLWPYIVAGIVTFTTIIIGSFMLPSTLSTVLKPSAVLFVTVLSGGALFLFVMMMHYKKLARELSQTLKKVEFAKAGLQKKYEETELALLSEPQILMRYRGENDVDILSCTLRNNDVLSLDHQKITQFSLWLTSDSVTDLTHCLENLEENAEEFDLIIITQQGNTLEAVGRISGDQALLKIRNLAGAGAVQQQLKDELDAMLIELMAARQLLDALPMPAWFRDEHHKLIWVNEAYARAVGVRDKSLVISVNAELLEQRHSDTISETLSKGHIFHTKTRMVLGGDQRYFDLIVVPIGENSAGIAIDVEDETNASENLQRHLQAFDDTLERVATAVVIFDANHNLQYYNESYMDLWEFNQDWLETYPTDSEILDRLRLNRQLPEQTDYNSWKNKILSLNEAEPFYEDWWYLRDGRILYVTGKLGPDRTITFCFENMTEQYDLESKYNALIRMQGATLNALNEGVAVFASNGRLKLMNPAFAQFWNLNPAIIDDAPHIDRIIAACQPLYKNNNYWDKVLEAVTVLDDSREYFTDKVTRDDGIVLANHVEPLPNGATMITFHDITELEKTAQILAERNEALQSADKLKNSFISNVSYDLRTPLTTIIGFTEMLMHGDDLNLGSDKQKEYLRDIHHSGQILESSINDILILAKIDAGKLDLELGHVDILHSLTAVIAQSKDIIMKKAIDVRTVMDHSDFDDFIADEKRVHQVLSKILSNAVAFTPQNGHITIVCTQQQQMMVFEITDSGKGIPRDKLDKVFNRFENTMDTVRGGNDEGGIGIGLAVARELVELHGGNIDISSLEGKGTTVRVSFPIDSRLFHDSKKGISAEGVGAARISDKGQANANAKKIEALSA